MEEVHIQDVLIKILRSELVETELDENTKQQISSEMLPALYKLSKAHDLAHIVSSALGKAGLIGEDEIAAKFQKQEMLAFYRHERMKYEFQQICEALEEAQVPYIPLKGSILRPFYPRESMRTSCDIDILIHEEDIECAVSYLTARGYRNGERNYHDISLFSASGIHLELHFNIQENLEPLDAILSKAWEYATLEKGYRYAFTDDFFVFHIFSHLSYHFLSGGCGIRSIMDLWIMKHKMGITYHTAKNLLEEAGIYKFAVEFTGLADICFSGKKGNEFSKELLSYVFSGGIYGSLENQIAIGHAKSNLSPKYIFKRLFIPYRDLVIQYTILKKLPILVPFCWIHRTFKLFINAITRMDKKHRLAKNISDSKGESTTKIRSKLGI